MKCRHCGTELKYTFIDLGNSPLSNSYLTEQTLREAEKKYSLKVMVCDCCWLVQTDDFVGVTELFSEDYAYFSSFSTSWLNHAKNYVDEMIARFNLSRASTVVEVAANDGYLLQYINEKKIPCYGIEPTHSTAQAARSKGIEIVEEFFDDIKAKELVDEGRQADLIVANNVLAHVPDINNFVKGFAILLKSDGVATFEFPHLFNLVEKNQFDTIYHEHYSYLSFIAVRQIFETNGLDIFDVDELASHGGSLRIYAQRQNSGQQVTCEAVKKLEEKECLVGMNKLVFYQGFQNKAEKIKTDFLSFLVRAKQQKKKVAAYGAAAKGNTILNFAGVRSDLIAYVVDKNPVKQGKFMPGSRLEIFNEAVLKTDKPDYVVILPWNLKNEVLRQLDYIHEWGGQFVVTMPMLKVL